MSPYDIIPLGIIILSLAGIIFIIVKKFPVLASINVETIQSEQEAVKKERIVAERLSRKISAVGKFLYKVLSPVGRALRGLFSKIYAKVLEWEKSYGKKRVKKLEEAPNTNEEIKTLFFEAEECFREGKNEEAEKKCIGIIALDHKNIDAYKKLGQVYLEQKNYDNAYETFKHLLKLNPDDVETLLDLGALCRERGENDAALANFKRAVELEPTSPRNLDFLIDISIIVKNKDLARETLKKLQEANPENQKLEEFEERIEAI
ncbi:tetratricopeptide repeat protein [Patescibacteria group bacterium]|nr:tetratricopeptide repeat protein [Patescibacteria group bacterium]